MGSQSLLDLAGACITAFASGLETVVLVASHTQWFLILIGLLVAAWVLREYWLQPLCIACESVRLPDPRNSTCICISCGWCIMNVWCPFICPKFHPPFGLRVIIVKAKRLQAEWTVRNRGYMHVYAQVCAGNNPAKTTSMQQYVFGRTDGAGETVWWNEPIDAVMWPSDNRVTINICRKEGSTEVCLGSVSLPVDGFYEPPGHCADCTVCGFYPCPKLCHQLCGAEYHWPFVRGAPTWWDRKRAATATECHDECEQGLCGCCKPKPVSMLTEVPLKGRETGAASLAAPVHHDRFWAIDLVQADGMQLEHLHDFQHDRDVVLAAVKQNGEAISFAAPELQSDLQVQRVAASVPRPMVLQLNQRGEDAGRLWAYFVLHGLGEDEGLPVHMMTGV